MKIPRIARYPENSFFLFGPRGTGKSTWLKMNFPDALWIDLLEPDLFRTYKTRPEKLKDLVLGNLDKKVVVIDEVQKVPELLTVVHKLIEENLNIRFILTGSSSRKLKKTGVDLLAGRAIKKTLHPFMACELGDLFELDKALKIGLIPLICDANNPEDVLRTYAALYVREEVQMEGLVRNLGDFSRFLEAISFSHGCVLNISNVARECEVERKVVENYVSIVEDLLLGYRIPIFAKRAKRELISRSKFYYFDAGLYRSLRPAGPLDRVEEIDGVALEGLVAQHLMALCSYRDDKIKLYFWRTKSGKEVDFVIYGEDAFFAVEVKNSDKIRNNDLKSLKSFKLDYPESDVFLVYRGKEKLKINDVLCVPVDKFLKDLVANI